ncbi:MAG TPA: amino acid adenylation domain-containing protein, partial [Rugosimonospora sp.]|nr:amino acid adenylation domain-containing protein [Rugosimonospora sp.]
PPEVVASLAAGNPVPCPVSIAFPATAPAHPAATVGEDVAIEVVPDGDGFRLCERYAAELFGPRRIGALLHHWERVVHAIVSAPDRAVAQAPLLDDGERAALLALGTGPDRPYPQTTLHSLVAQRMRDTPDALAGICAGERLTYGELDRRSALLAARLRQAGAGPGSVVAVVLGRSLHTLVAMLGVLRAGAAYTPIDPQFPAQRIRFVLDDTAAPVVLTLDGLLGDCRPPEGVTVLRLDADWPAIEDATRDAAPVPDQAGPESLAYVLFTSGSTGTPKGVLLEHGMIVNYLTWMVEECRIDAGTRMLHACSPVFDLAVGEIFAALTSGACVVVATHDEVVSPGELTRVIAQGRVTHSFTPPTTLGLVDPAACADLRCVLVAGEVVAPELVERWLDRGARVMNLYGPAEAAVSCTFFDCVPGAFGSSIPIGVVMPNRAVRVLDPAGEPVPVGVPGELVVAGVGVARGYLNRPELTAQRFGSDPFGAGTAYRTGDLARWNAAGQLEFLGRLDTQVKLNGLRIELGEIEAVLATHPDVGAAVVAVRADRGPARLVGYVVARDGRRPDPVELREHAARVLPPYMVPAAFVTVAAFPLGATGKVNRAALPAPGAGRPPLRTPYRAPETPGQARVTAMIEAVL